MSDGIRWLIDAGDRWMDCVTFARGISPEELAIRLGAKPGSSAPLLTASEAWDLAHGWDSVIVRVGSSDGWSFAVESGLPQSADVLEELSRGGVEIVRLDPQPDHPPMQFAYLRDGAPVCSFGITEEGIRWGHDPDFLLPDLIRTGVLCADGERLHDDGMDYAAEKRRTFGVLEHRFGLSLPRKQVEEVRLPAYALYESPGFVWPPPERS
ncbi:DUF6461 domain-containing protein [Streptomyces sp. NPDC088354]|uniref:DUF6461 domain-containing protein n=1 Tax=Streptomyces sp. NPDC088354 TaxID=3365856 RepID=UPI003800D6CF